MKNLRERTSAERGDRSERDAPARTSSAPENPILAARGLALDGMGNRALLTLLRAGQIQRKARVSEPGDPLEHEADCIADQVMRMPAPEVSITAAPLQVSRKCDACEEDGKVQTLQTKPDGSPEAAASSVPPRIQRFSGQSNGQAEAVPASVDQVLSSPGKPLEPALRRDMEQRFGYDFSRVRVHYGAAAEQSAREVDANAYTIGHDIVFGTGHFAPSTHEGRRLMAHELTHVVQQSGAEGIRVGQSNEKRGLSPIPTLQQRAAASRPMALAQDRAGQQTVQGKPESIVRILQRQPQPDDTERCPRGEIRLGPGHPCVPLILPGRECPMGQVRLSPDLPCVPWRPRPRLLGGELTPPSPLPGPSPSTPSPSGASTSGKSARIVRMEGLRECAYSVNYSNPRQVDCDTVFRNERGTNPPVPLCGVSLVYDILSVSASGSRCPAKLEGLKVSEVVKGDQGCTPPGFVWPAPNPCVIGPGGKISGCTDTFTVCGPTRGLQGNGCTEIVDQEIEVGGQLAEEHEITFDLKKSGKDCTGKVTRN